MKKILIYIQQTHAGILFLGGWGILFLLSNFASVVAMVIGVRATNILFGLLGMGADVIILYAIYRGIRYVFRKKKKVEEQK